MHAGCVDNRCKHTAKKKQKGVILAKYWITTVAYWKLFIQWELISEYTYYSL